MTLEQAIHALYDGLPADASAPPIHPFIGRRYGEATTGVLRVLLRRADLAPSLDRIR